MDLLKKYWLGFALAALLAVAGVMIYVKLHPRELPANLVEGTGRIDGDIVNLNVKYPGRISNILVDDGVPVKKGMVVAHIKSSEYEAKEAQIAQEILAKKNELKAKTIELVIAEKTIPLTLKKSADALRISIAQSKELERGISSQKDILAQDKRDLSRTRNLFKKRLIQKELLEKQTLKYNVDMHKLESLKHKKEQLFQAINIAKSNLKAAQASQKKISALKEGIKAMQEGIKAMQEGKNQIKDILSEMILKSPLDGFAIEKIANAGEVIGAGMPVATLIDPHTLYLKIFVDTIQNGKIKLHDKAEIFLDAYPNHPIQAEVVRIAQKAEFTPKDVSVRSDRIQRVFQVHLKPLKVNPLLKLGIPAIGVVSLDGKGLPKSLDEIPVL